MTASGAATSKRDARRGVQYLDRQHGSVHGAHRCRDRRADVCDSSARALASATGSIWRTTMVFSKINYSDELRERSGEMKAQRRPHGLGG
jgi:hypothetical protein